MSIQGKYLASGAAAFAVAQLAACLYPPLVTEAFCKPAAHLSALFLNAPCLRDSGAVFTIPLAALDVRVTEACSGFGFFSLALALLAASKYLSFYTHDRGWKMTGFLMIGFVFALALAANTIRIVAGTYVRLAGDPFLNVPLLNAAHMAVGVFTFLPALIVVHLITQGRPRHA